jgi:thiol-disulfide isomerase/thioredoxin
MKKLSTLVFLPLLIILAFQAAGQSTAMDFTQDECEGNPHHLYSELDAGNVVIMEFVMLNCAPCISGTKALENITAPYAVSHPGRVHIYSYGFLNSYNCEQMTAWKIDNEFSHPVFSEGEDQVAYYGGMGMPTIVVTGTNMHKVFFKSIGYTAELDEFIKQAIDSALLYNPTGVGENKLTANFRVYPTVITDNFRIEAGQDTEGAEYTVCNSSGKVVLTGTIPGNGVAAVASSGLAKGIYFVRLKQDDNYSEGIKLIKL